MADAWICTEHEKPWCSHPHCILNRQMERLALQDYKTMGGEPLPRDPMEIKDRATMLGIPVILSEDVPVGTAILTGVKPNRAILIGSSNTPIYDAMMKERPNVRTR